MEKESIEQVRARYENDGCSVSSYLVETTLGIHAHEAIFEDECVCCQGVCDCQYDGRETEVTLLMVQKDGRMIAEVIEVPGIDPQGEIKIGHIRVTEYE